jgi:hypothetical protein
MGERSRIALKLIATHLVFISGLTAATFFIRQDNYMTLYIAQTFLIILFFAGYWEFFSSGFKSVFLLMIEIVLIISIVLRTDDGKMLQFIPMMVILLGLTELYLLSVLIKILIVILKRERESLEITFPFKGGIYLITDGGNSGISRMMNYHFHSRVHRQRKTNRSMLHATDVVRLNTGKFKFIPLVNEEYLVFNQQVFCPMEGKVIKVVNNIDDNESFSGNYPYNTGNTVVIKKGNYYMLLGHLKKGSIVVCEGDSVEKDEIVGRAGNSGMSERPHLHMQLIRSEDDNYWSGTGISMTYKGRNLYKNRKIILK